RVLCERLAAGRVRGEAPSQPLLDATVVALSAAQTSMVTAEAETLTVIGWQLEATDGAAVIVRAVPAALAGRNVTRALTDYLDRLDAEERLSGPDRAVATLACRAAV